MTKCENCENCSGEDITDEMIEKQLPEEDEQFGLFIEEEPFMDGVKAGSFYAGFYQSLIGNIPEESAIQILLKYMDNVGNLESITRSGQCNFEIAKLDSQKISL